MANDIEIVKAVQQIERAISTIADGPDVWEIVAQLGSAAASAAAAVLAAIWAIRYQNRRLSDSVIAAIAVEVKEIVATIQSAIDSESRSAHISLLVLSDPSKVCPVYQGLADRIGYVDKEKIKEIVGFYAKLLSLNPVYSESNGGLCYKRSDVNKLLAVGREVCRNYDL